MEPYELLDRFELLHPTNTKLADLRRAYIDKDLSSIFRLTFADEELRKAVIEKNLHSIFRLMPDEHEELRKAVVEENLHSIFRLIQGNVTGDIEDLRKAVVEQNLHSLFRLLEVTGNNEDLRKAVTEKNLHALFRLIHGNDDIRSAVTEENLHSIFRLVDDEELRKLVLEDNTWKLWPILDRYIDTQFVAAFKNFFVNETKIWDDCFSRGQLESKLWLVKELQKTKVDLGTVFLCAGWYATLAVMLFESNIKVDKVRSFDTDPTCAKIAEVFNKPWFEDNWRFKASTVDIMDFEWSDAPAPSDGTLGNFYYMTSSTDKSIQMKDNPDTIINTSCEHIENFAKWYDLIPDGKLVILQSNNFFEVEEHVNCVSSIEEFTTSAPMQNVLYQGELELPKYKRYMLIGYK